ncbi:MAG: hypothetical protein IJN25_09465 [Clostridia bacterium]|nr:hypothetical protein [Clostridia bacterium]
MTSIILGQYSKGFIKNKGHVTLGVSSEVFQKIQSLPRINPLFENAEDAVFVEPLPCCTVKYMEKNISGSLRQSVFKTFCEDKSPVECMEH